MKRLTTILPLLLTFLLISGCDKDDNDVPETLDVQDFVWKGLNLYYLWQADVPDLADSRFSGQDNLNNFLAGYSDPENLFYHLLNKPSALANQGDEVVDRFSVIFDDYTRLEGILSGTTDNTGADVTFYYKDDSQVDVIGVVNYILPNSDAASKDIRRGDIIYAVYGVTLTAENFSSLRSGISYTVNLADYDGGNITPNGRSVSLTKTVVSENPVYITSVINSGDHRIGYLMYNGFYPDYESQMNTAFAQLKAANITDFVLDLRYNSGGSIDTAARLASMITGQFAGQIFAKEQWNGKVEAYFASHGGGLDEYNYFPTAINSGAAINSLNVSRVYVITTQGTASASELVINGLEPYIDVIQVGDKTVGKNVGSITLYDSPTFTKSDISSRHRYAMQPLVLKIVNKNGFGDYTSGLIPDIQLRESLGNFGVLGDSGEPLLNAAISQISGSGRKPKDPGKELLKVRSRTIEDRLGNEMYLNTNPPMF